MASLDSFEDLDCWKESVKMRRYVRSIAKGFPPDEKFRLTDQLIRSSRSPATNIAEGFGRYTFQENSRFCWIARGSLCETLDHMILAREENYITPEELQIFRNQYTLCMALLNGYINYLQRTKKSSSTEDAKSKSTRQ